MKKLITLIAVVFCFVSKAQIITTICGDSIEGYSGDGGQAINAEIYFPFALAIDAAGNLYIADYNNNRVRKITTSGIISTFAGNGTNGYSGDGGQATAAKLNQPNGITIDAMGNLYISDPYNYVIRKINTTGIISTIAGTGTAGYSGDGGQATLAELNYPYGLDFDAFGNLYMVDLQNMRIRMINTGGIISTVAGNGTQGYSGDGGLAINAEIDTPSGITFDAAGNLYISDSYNNKVRKVNAAGIINTVAGNGTPGYSGDGGQATNAKLYWPTGLVVDGLGNLYIGDNDNSRVRKVNTAGIITTIAGNGTNGYSGDGGQATSAELAGLNGFVFDAGGNLYIADTGNNRIRKITMGGDEGGIEEHTTNNNISVYPNPTTGMLNVGGLMLNGNISICDVLGNEVITTKEKQIDVSSLANGVYFIKTTQGTQKFIKQ